MLRRPWFLPFLVLLLACLTTLPACKKKKKDNDIQPADPNAIAGSGPGDGTSPPAAAASSDYLLFAHINVKSVRDSALFADVKQAVTKAGGTDVWNKTEGDAAKEMGFKPSDLDSVTVCVPEFPTRGQPKVIAILASSVAIDKANAADIKGQKPDARGFYKTKGDDGLLHFPDDKTAVFLSKDLADKYLAGYGKNRSGWPMTPELSKAAGGHTLYATVNVTKVPKNELPPGDNPQMQALLSARAVTLTADLKGKAISLGARATFPDAATAGKAKDTVQQFLGMAAGFVDQATNGKELASLSSLKPVVQEAQRTLKEAKVEASGSDVTLAATYRADFDIAKIAADAVPQIQAAESRMKAQNNLKQIGLALHIYHDAMQRLPIHGIAAKGMPLKDANEKPLLSWRVAILPYIEQGNLYNQFKLDEPWDSANNKKLIEKMPKIFEPVAKPGKPGYTHLQMVVGPGAMQPGMKFPASFSDGTSNTIAVVEAAEPVIWTKPDDVMVPGKEMPKDLKKKFGGQFPGGFNVVMWDGSVRFISDSISERTLWLAINPADGMPLPSDWDGGPTRPGGPGAVPPKRPGGPGGFVPPRPPGPPGVKK
jgi:prepilin-type processing-associated H-X9-DG protein